MILDILTKTNLKNILKPLTILTQAMELDFNHSDSDKPFCTVSAGYCVNCTIRYNFEKVETSTERF